MRKLDTAPKIPLNILCALTPGQKLSNWQAIGTLERELQPYYYQLKLGNKITFLELKLGRSPIPTNMSVISLPNWRLLPVWARIARPFFTEVNIIKTNQSYNSHLFVHLSKVWRIPIVLRCGMVFGERLESVEGPSKKVKDYQSKEAWAFQNCTLAELPTEELGEWVKSHYHISEEKIRIVPNFVDTQEFHPNSDCQQNNEAPLKVISVGRLHAIKRFELLIEACALVQIPLHIAGEGSEKENLLRLASDFGIDLILIGQLPHEKLADFIRQGDIFVITSLREGHPKALIEAMACGLPCVCVNVPGVRNIIKDGVNGLLVNGSPGDIAKGIELLANDRDLRFRLGQSAREYAIKHYDITRILRMDSQILLEAFRLRE